MSLSSSGQAILYFSIHLLVMNKSVHICRRTVPLSSEFIEISEQLSSASASLSSKKSRIKSSFLICGKILSLCNACGMYHGLWHNLKHYALHKRVIVFSSMRNSLNTIFVSRGSFCSSGFNCNKVFPLFIDFLNGRKSPTSSLSPFASLYHCPILIY